MMFENVMTIEFPYGRVQNIELKKGETENENF